MPTTPFGWPEYALPETARAAGLRAEAASESSLAAQSTVFQILYVLLTVIFASVLFFGSISGRVSVEGH